MRAIQLNVNVRATAVHLSWESEMRLRVEVVLLFVIASAIHASCAHAQPRPGLDPDACWRFEIVSEPGPHPPTSPVPPLAILTDTPTSSPTRFLVRRLNGDGRWRDAGSRSPLSAWYWLPGADSVRVSFSEGFAEYGFTLAVPGRANASLGDTLRGRAHLWSDDGPAIYQMGEARAVRVSCPVARVDSLTTTQASPFTSRHGEFGLPARGVATRPDARGDGG